MATWINLTAITIHQKYRSNGNQRKIYTNERERFNQKKRAAIEAIC